MKILFMEPVMKQMIWGGSRLRTEFGYEIPGENTGECWSISAHPSGDCRVMLRQSPDDVDREDARVNGKFLSELWQDHRELFGGMEGGVFPLLTKIIDAAADLSIQVHPDNEYAGLHENGALGKTECWYILDCEPGTTIIIGHHARTKKELHEMVEAGRFQDLIREIPVHPGDFFQINPGCVHAIKAGTLLLETQQSSDITYRLYDYGRLQNGKPRELHLEKSMDVITCPAEGYQIKETDSAEMTVDTEKEGNRQREKGGQEERHIRYQAENGSVIEHLVTCPYYTVERIQVKQALLLTDIRKAGSVKFDLFSVIAGEGSLAGVKLKKGDHFILPYRMPDGTGESGVEFQGELELIHATP